MTATVTKALIPAAGLGTRFLPATKAVPKELLPIVDVPTLQYIVQEAVDAGIEELVLVNGRGKGAIEDHFDRAYELEDTLERRGKKELLEMVQSISRMITLVSVRQKDPLGLGHAVLKGLGPISRDERFAVLLGDDLIDGEDPAIGQLIRASDATGGGAVALMEVPADQVSSYGVVGGTWEGDYFRVTELVEKPDPADAPSKLAIVGRYVLPGTVFGYIEATEPGHGGEIQLTDAMKNVAKNEGLVGVRFTGQRHDAGHQLGWLEANLAYGLKRPELRDGIKALMRRLLEETE